MTELIVITPEVNAQAQAVPFLDKVGVYGNWHLYRSKLPAPLVEVVKTPPQFIPEKNFKADFYNWFLRFTGEEPLLIATSEAEKQKTILLAVDGSKSCHPELKVEFDQIHLKTDCPGQLHVLKFAYHSTWKASTKDDLYLISPGFIGIIPSQSQVTLAWGQHWLWTLSNFISWITLFYMFVVVPIRERRSLK